MHRYDAIESVECRMQEILSPTPDGEYVGSATVQEVFNIGGTGNIAGSKCKDGIIRKGSNVRILRGDKILAESKVKTLRNFKVCSICNGADGFIPVHCLLFALMSATPFSLKWKPSKQEMNVVLAY